jgi:prepilin-type N-terminal cleavage/methylation domain-containing protein
MIIHGNLSPIVDRSIRTHELGERTLVEMRKRGFTLVELLVVIAIIAILAAMITPVILEAKDAARMKRCVSNLRQLGMAITQYMDDNGGYGLPIDRTPAPAPPLNSHCNENPWILYVKPLRTYVGQDVQPPRPDDIPGYQQPSKIWICSGDIWRGPSDNDKPCWWHWGSSYLYPGTTAYISTSINDPAGKDITAKHASCVPLRPMTWRCVRRDLLLADYWFDFHRGYKVDKNVKNPQIFWRDVGGKKDVACINVVFLDLHAAAVTPGQRDDLIDNVRVTDNPYYVAPE